MRDPAQHREVIDNIISFGKTLRLQNRGVTPSPILGPKGNREFLIHLVGLKAPVDASTGS